MPAAPAGIAVDGSASISRRPYRALPRYVLGRDNGPPVDRAAILARAEEVATLWRHLGDEEAAGRLARIATAL